MTKPKAAKTVEVTYDGDGVDVKLPSGRVLTDVARGDTVEVDQADAKALATLPDWSTNSEEKTAQ